MRGSHCNQENFKSERIVRDSHLPQVVEEPRLSASCIRNLVKQLTLLGVKDRMNQNEHLDYSPVYGRPHESSTHPQTLEESQQAQPPQPSKPKNQIRRRLVTRGPCEENSLDMAEARREVATAHRLHRACMYQNSDIHPQAPLQTHSASSSRATQPQHKRKSKSRKKSKPHDFSTTPNFSNSLYNLSYQSFPYQPPQTSYSWPMYVSAPPPIPEDFNIPNLNLQDFDGLDTTVLLNNYTPARCYSSTSPSTSNLLPLSAPYVGLQNNYTPARCYSSTSPSTSNFFPLSVAREETPYVGLQNNYIPARCYSSTSPSTYNSLPLSVAREETPYVGLQNNYTPARCYSSTSPLTYNSLPLSVAGEETPYVGLQNNYTPALCYSSTSPSTSNSLPLSVAGEETPYAGLQNNYTPARCYSSTSSSTSNSLPLSVAGEETPYAGLQNNYTPARCYSSTSPSTSNSLPLSVAGEETPYVGLQNNYTPALCYSSTSPSTSNSLPLSVAGEETPYVGLQNNYTPARCYSSTSPSTSNSLPLSVAREETPYVGLSQAPVVADPGVEEDLGLHHAVDDEEMAEIRSVAEQHQIEWDDTINMVNSAWWSDILNTKENDSNRLGMEFPPWLNTNDNCSQQLDEHYSSDCFQDPTLPQIDIGEIEGTDGEWLG